MYEILLISLFAVFPSLAELDDEVIVHPTQITQCLKEKKVSDLTILTDNNPYYLRGDFDGDGRFDYALEVQSRKSGKNGMLICSGAGLSYILGSGVGGEQFSDMEDDNFLAPHWKVITQEEVVELGKWKHNVPDRISLKRGREAIEMLWEDGISLIYWNGAKYKWAGSKE